MPKQASTASSGRSANTPVRMKNSPTNALEPGIASAAMATTRKTPASQGAPLARPPIWSISSLPRLARAMMPTMANAAAVTMPWLIICSTAPCPAVTLNAMIPSTMKPR